MLNDTNLRLAADVFGGVVHDLPTALTGVPVCLVVHEAVTADLEFHVERLQLIAALGSRERYIWQVCVCVCVEFTVCLLTLQNA